MYPFDVAKLLSAVHTLSRMFWPVSVPRIVTVIVWLSVPPDTPEPTKTTGNVISKPPPAFSEIGQMEPPKNPVTFPPGFAGAGGRISALAI